MELSSPGSKNHGETGNDKQSLNVLKPYQKELREQCHNLNGDNTENSHMPAEKLSTQIKETLQNLSEESVIEPYESDKKVSSLEIIAEDSIDKSGSLTEKHLFPENTPLCDENMFENLKRNSDSVEEISSALSAASIGSPSITFHPEITSEKALPLQESYYDSRDDESARPTESESSVLTKPHTGT